MLGLRKALIAFDLFSYNFKDYGCIHPSQEQIAQSRIWNLEEENYLLHTAVSVRARDDRSLQLPQDYS